MPVVERTRRGQEIILSVTTISMFFHGKRRCVRRLSGIHTSIVVTRLDHGACAGYAEYRGTVPCAVLPIDSALRDAPVDHEIGLLSNDSVVRRIGLAASIIVFVSAAGGEYDAGDVSVRIVLEVVLLVVWKCHIRDHGVIDWVRIGN